MSGHPRGPAVRRTSAIAEYLLCVLLVVAAGCLLYLVVSAAHAVAEILPLRPSDWGVR